ncbi:hypothetical protein KKF61_08430 [Patescibacteria group bacterium]|nr:hypothetical protein [Patescibacteria group bacterium]
MKGTIVILGAASLVPVWRSGGRKNMTFWGWIWNHTVFGPRVEYVPEEDYTAELCKVAGRIR